MTSTKSYVIAKRAVWEAYQQVKANRGSAGIDEETIAMFDQNLPRNLYKLWNRMSSGSYFPPPVKQVEIPRQRAAPESWVFRPYRTALRRPWSTTPANTNHSLGTPVSTPSSRFSNRSPSRLVWNRPGRSAKQAIAVTRKRCWRYDWVVEFDIKAAFDQIDHGLLMKAVRSHIGEGWMLLYIERGSLPRSRLWMASGCHGSAVRPKAVSSLPLHKR